jgi:hypothetical protein
MFRRILSGEQGGPSDGCGDISGDQFLVIVIMIVWLIAHEAT